MGLIIILVIICIVLVVANIPNKGVINRHDKGSDFDIDPIVGDFGIDPLDIPDAQPTTVAQKPKKKYKRKPKNKKPIE